MTSDTETTKPDDVISKVLEGREGCHYCPDWDGELICNDDPEFEVCTCVFTEEE